MTFFGFYVSTQQLGITCIILALVLAVLLIKDSILDEITLFTPVELRKVNKAMNKFNSQREVNVVVSEKSKKVKLFSELFKKLKIFPFSDDVRDEYIELIARLDVKDKNGYRKVPEEFYVQSCFNVISLVVGCLGCFWLAKISGETLLNLISLIALIMIPVVYRMPLTTLRKDKKKNIVEIDKDMIEFISMFYYRFSNEKIEFDLDDLIDSFLPLANKDMYRMLVRFQLDIRGLGDANALNILHRKYGDSAFVPTFCNVALGVLEKRPNAYIQLSGLFDRLESMNRLRYKKECEKKHAKKKNAYKIILGLFCVEMAVFIVFQIMAV